MTAGTVLEIFTAPTVGAAMVPHMEAVALAGSGLEGDRYAAGIGFYSEVPITPGARELTLIDLNAVSAAAEQAGVPFSTVECRRNLITSGVDLDALIGKAFTIGEVTCEGVRRCPPCVHLEELTGKKVMKALTRTGGLRARIVRGGTIRAGDTIEVIGPSTGSAANRDA